MILCLVNKIGILLYQNATFAMKVNGEIGFPFHL
jgi:hypothetical protein